MARIFCTYDEHDWNWQDDIEAWECDYCHAKVNANPQIEPCINCGQDVCAISVYCQDCLDEFYGKEMTLAELSAYVNVPHVTLRQAAWSGRLKARKSGRTWLATAEAVREFIESRWQRSSL